MDAALAAAPRLWRRAQLRRLPGPVRPARLRAGSTTTARYVCACAAYRLWAAPIPKLLDDPYTSRLSGQSYSHVPLLQALELYGREPLTNTRATIGDFVPNRALAAAVEHWKRCGTAGVLPRLARQPT